MEPVASRKARNTASVSWRLTVISRTSACRLMILFFGYRRVVAGAGIEGDAVPKARSTRVTAPSASLKGAPRIEHLRTLAVKRRA